MAFFFFFFFFFRDEERYDFISCLASITSKVRKGGKESVTKGGTESESGRHWNERQTATTCEETTERFDRTCLTVVMEYGSSVDTKVQ